MSVQESPAKNGKEITILGPCLKFLQVHYFWPKTSEVPESHGAGHRIKVLAFMTLPYTLLVTAILHIVYVKTNNLDVNLNQDFVLIMSGSIFGMVSLEFYNNQKQYVNFLLQLCDYKFGRPEDLNRTERLLNLLTKALYYLAVLTVTINGLIPFIEQSRCEEHFKMKKIDELCGYFIPIPPFLVPKSDTIIIIKPLIMAIQIFGTIRVSLPAVMISLLVFEINVHLVVHMRHLKSQLKSLSPSRDAKKELYNLVKYHQHIIKLMDSMNSCSSRGLCIHTFVTSTILGSIIHQIVNLTWETPIAPAMDLSFWIVALLLNSLGGEIILNESTDICTASYFSNWLELDQSIKKDVLLIMIRTQKPLLLKAGPFGCMSLGGFVSILKGLHTLTISLMSR